MPRALLSLLLVSLLLAPMAAAIETDQYYTWGRSLEDSTDVMNAKVNLELGRVLEEVNQSPSGLEASCSDVRKRVVNHFRLFLIHRLELWAINSQLVSRSPATAEEELQYRQEYLYHNRNALDPAQLMAPSPSIQVSGVRFGTDKLTHFFSEGWWYFKFYRKGLRKGMSHEEAVLKAIDTGALSERTVLGMAASGVFSVADLEANHEGLRFMIGLCDPDAPQLVRKGGGWQLREPFDFRTYVTPEWDESWTPSVIGRYRWKRVRPVLEEYCPMLETPEVQAQRQRYAARDSLTLTEREIRELVEKGKLPDPETFSIDTVCAELHERQAIASGRLP